MKVFITVQKHFLGNLMVNEFSKSVNSCQTYDEASIECPVFRLTVYMTMAEQYRRQCIAVPPLIC